MGWTRKTSSLSEGGAEVAGKMLLALEDGALYEGYAFGAPSEAEGEVVFNTSMTGYQEICTDPSYRGQMVVLTYPLIGNYGVTVADLESRRPWIEALIVREYYGDYSNWRAAAGLQDCLAQHGIPAIEGVDTRSLTKRLRTYGTMRAVLAFADTATPEELVARARRATPLSEKDLVGETSFQPAYEVPPTGPWQGPGARPKIVVVDCGLKGNIVRSLSRRGAQVTVAPHTSTAQDILSHRPDGVVYSNGPGDPATLPAQVAVVRELLAAGGPFLGICLGHQILAQAIGGRTGRLKFGHHGGNHPVKDSITGRVHITSQNHEFQVLADSIPKESGFFVSHINLNDNSVEGLAHPSWPVFSVQYHPEGSPGPQDNQYLFDRFLEMVVRARRR